MRLIDADKVIAKAEFISDITPQGVITDRVMISYNNITTEPTVEAIPIEYIMAQIEMYDGLSDICDDSWGDIYNTFSQLLRSLIAPWRKDMGDKGERK